ncbi:MAG TPA: hypothetical protein P5275_05340 [Saprospiraceae bacterium]|nr:hypothetical protein [Lewinellaceae bacterium]HPG05339.1 hypothetical protein [Saprospiraceae bacterium]HPQ98117.1 hypothetical protein [Saprospiraceae bacterium]HRV84260.1 hypothetical protein [Saprospiraceae bacterium]
MHWILIVSMILLVAALLVTNIYYRIKVLKLSRKLSRSKIEISPKMLFQPGSEKEDLLNRYPGHRKDILQLASYMKQSMRTFIVLLAAILLIAWLFNNGWINPI